MDSFRALRLVFVFCLCLCSSIEAHADLIIGTPSGLSPGDQFRIVFVTVATTQATSGDIGYYNTFVTADAITQAGGIGNNVSYGGTVLTWTAIASTNDVSAISNIGSFGVPVYLASGTRVSPSDTLSGLWSGSLESPINEFLTDPFFYDTAVWTGTMPDGSNAGSFTLGSGSGFGSLPGLSNKSNSEWVATGATPSNFSNNMYGISQVLTVAPAPSPVPEVDPACFGSVAALFTGALGLIERRRMKAKAT